MTERWSVLVPDEIDESGPDSIRDFADIDTYDVSGSPEDILDVVEAYDAIILRTVPLPARVFERANNLKVVSKHGTGTDMIDIDAATAHGVVVCNTPGANARAVAEFAIALLLAAWKDVRNADSGVRSGEWDAARHNPVSKNYPNFSSKTLGILGCGNIGSETAEMGQGLGMRTVAYDPYLDADELPEGVEKVRSKREFFEASDAVSVHVPLTDETRDIVSTEELRQLGTDGILVNTARGPVVDEDALVEALRAGTIHRAALDVLATEPPDPDNPLLGRDDVLLSPHRGGLSKDAFREMSLQAAANVRTVYEGGTPSSTLNGVGE